MSQYLTRRLLLVVPTLVGLSMVVFALVRLLPGDAVTMLLQDYAYAKDADEMRAKLGLDRPMYEQYVGYLGDAVRFDFGDSQRLGRPAMDAVLDRLPATIDLTLAATLLAVVIGLVLGVVAGGRPGSRLDRIVSAATIGLQSFPTFWVGIMLILLFSLGLRLLPSAGVGTPAHLVLPAVTLSLPFVAIVARVTRGSVAESMDEQYVQTARSKGLTNTQVLLGHVLRNSLVPVVTVVGIHIGQLMGGVVIVENVFAWPGLGSLIVDAVANRDYAVVQAATLLIATIVLVLNLVADLVYTRLDPRIRLEGVS